MGQRKEKSFYIYIKKGIFFFFIIYEKTIQNAQEQC